MKPWQSMILLSIAAAIVASYVGALVPGVSFEVAVGIGATTAIVAMVVMRPKEN